ncbi:nucleotide pyrophosphohydrolase [Patescibacteria group bacterium]|nr:nucleotide pyrophosphohydrolase [Patescibacteria group bacterium]MBU1953146.1 nucleotide pyrophosphohydrolase [Patescibacteria group bacterium]
MRKIQKQTDDWIKKCGYGYFSPHGCFVAMAEEVGELAREINHVYGPKKKKATEKNNNIADELGDLLFTTACLANSLNIDLDKSFERLLKKLYTRDKDRYKKKK